MIKEISITEKKGTEVEKGVKTWVWQKVLEAKRDKKKWMGKKGKRYKRPNWSKWRNV